MLSVERKALLRAQALTYSFGWNTVASSQVSKNLAAWLLELAGPERVYAVEILCGSGISPVWLATAGVTCSSKTAGSRMGAVLVIGALAIFLAVAK